MSSITLVRSAKGAAQTGTTNTIAFDATGCDMLVVGARDLGNSPLITGVTFGGVAMTRSRHDGTDGRATSIYTLASPPSGTGKSVVITYSGGATGLGAVVSGWSGNGQAIVVGNTNGRADTVASGGSGIGSATANNVVITMSDPTSVAVDYFVITKGQMYASPPLTPGGSQTLIDGMLQGDSFCYDESSYLTNASKMYWTWDGARPELQSQSVIELKLGAAVTTTVSSVSVTPTTATVSGGATQQFSASVAGTGSPSQSVTWSVSPAGSIDTSGLLTAPAATGSAQTLTVTATSVADNTKSGTATVTVPANTGTVSGVSVSPSAPSVGGGATQQFTATVAGTGSPSQAVTWSTNLGTITTGGLWTAPAATSSVQTATITATSVQNSAKSGTASPTVPASVVPTLSATFLSVFGQEFNYADRVRDTGTVAADGHVVLAGTPPAGSQTFAAGIGVGAKNIPYVVEDANGAWETRVGTLTASLSLSRDSILSSSNGGAAATFSGQVNVYCDVVAAVMKRLGTDDFINARRYGVDPTFTNDSTAAIQAIINDAFLSGLPAHFPPGRYKIAGALKAPDDFGRGCNGQLYIPATPSDSTMKHVYLKGATPPNMQYSALVDEPVINQGVIFESTLTPAQSTGTLPAVLYASQGYSNGYGTFNFTDVTLENIVIRTNAANGASQMCGFNAQALSNMPIFRGCCRIEVNVGLYSNPDPTAVGSWGLIMSPINNSGMAKSEFLFIGGFANAVQFSEHTHFDRLTVYGCGTAVTLQPAYHSSYIGHLNVEGCKNSIVINGDHALFVGLYDVEHNNSVAWRAFAYDIKYVTGSRKVHISLSTVVKQGVGISDADWATNATSANYKVVSGAGAN
jgi:hypothetical protein